MFLPDINIWLALAFEVHSGHRDALRWFDRQEEETCFFCRTTQAGFMRLATNPVLFGPDTCSLSDAWSFFDRFLEDPRFLYSQEPPGLEHFWRSFTMASTFSPKVWNDAYLAAFALAGGYGLVSFDKAFTAYRDLSFIDPAAST